MLQEQIVLLYPQDMFSGGTMTFRLYFGFPAPVVQWCSPVHFRLKCIVMLWILFVIMVLNLHHLQLTQLVLDSLLFVLWSYGGLGAKLAVKRGYTRVIIESDAKELLSWLLMRWLIDQNWNLLRTCQDIMEIMRVFPSFTVSFVGQDVYQAAHLCARQAL